VKYSRARQAGDLDEQAVTARAIERRSLVQWMSETFEENATGREASGEVLLALVSQVELEVERGCRGRTETHDAPTSQTKTADWILRTLRRTHRQTISYISLVIIYIA
jgi:hypothetical protein